MRVLLVDDNPHDRGLVARQLRKEYSDLQLLEATNQNQLDEFLRAGRFDIVITDFALRWSNGLAVLHQVKAQWPRCPVIMFTATGSETIATEAMKTGLDDYIVKSAKHAVRLRAAVRAALEHVETESKLKRLEFRLTHLLALLHVGIFQAQPDGRLLETNEAFRRILGLPITDDPSGEMVGALIGNSDEFNCHWNEALSCRGRYDFEIPLRLGDGTELWLALTLKAIDTGYGEKVVKGLVEDITLQKSKEENLRRREAELAHVTRLNTMGELVAGLAHELNQPLAAISNYCTTNLLALQDAEFSSAEQVRENSRRIAAQSDRAANILGRVRGFLDRREPVRATVKLGPLLRESVQMVEFLAREAGVRIELSKVKRSFTVEVDRVQIQQVVINLLRNAFDAMAETPPENRVLLISTHQEESRVVIAIHDRGHGLPQRGAEELFHPFVTNKPSGMGMGLAVSTNLVKQHGGHLSATANEYGGATFHFTLPLCQTESARGAREPASQLT